MTAEALKQAELPKENISAVVTVNEFQKGRGQSSDLPLFGHAFQSPNLNPQVFNSSKKHLPHSAALALDFVANLEMVTEFLSSESVMVWHLRHLNKSSLK